MMRLDGCVIINGQVKKKATPIKHRMKLGELIATARKLKFASQEDAAIALAVSRSALSKWENGSNQVDPSRYSKLMSVLGISRGDIEAYASASSSRTQYVGASFNQWVDIGFKIDELILHAYDIMSEWPSPIVPLIEGSNYYGDDSKWDELAHANPMGCFLVIEKNSARALGYWQVLSINKPTYDKGIRGENINKILTISDVHSFLLPNRSHSIYFVDCFIRKSHLQSAVSLRLFQGFLDFLNQLADTGQYVERILAHASETVAESLCLDTGFRVRCSHQEHRRFDQGSGNWVATKVYELDLFKNPDNAFFRNDHGLMMKYRDRPIGLPEKFE